MSSPDETPITAAEILSALKSLVAGLPRDREPATMPRARRSEVLIALQECADHLEQFARKLQPEPRHAVLRLLRAHRERVAATDLALDDFPTSTRGEARELVSAARQGLTALHFTLNPQEAEAQARIRVALEDLAAASGVLLRERASLTARERTALRLLLDETAKEVAILSDALDPIILPDETLDPGDPETMGSLIADRLLARPARPLSDLLALDYAGFYGAGVYAIYYSGDFPAYARITGEEWPIYVGMAAPAALRGPVEVVPATENAQKDPQAEALDSPTEPTDPAPYGNAYDTTGELPALSESVVINTMARTPREQGPTLARRLLEHAKNIQLVEDFGNAKGLPTHLRLKDFSFRHIVIKSGWAEFAEAHLIHRYWPVWNRESRVCFGFGKHGDRVETRGNVRSPWDILHPGRKWAKKSEASLKSEPTPEEVAAKVLAHLIRHSP